MTNIRRQAEELLQDQEPLKDEQVLSLENLVQELRVHQIELELQNEELRKTQDCLEQAKQKYEQLYNFAPVGYFTFDADGIIIDINWNATKQLGLEKKISSANAVFILSCAGIT